MSVLNPNLSGIGNLRVRTYLVAICNHPFEDILHCLILDIAGVLAVDKESSSDTAITLEGVQQPVSIPKRPIIKSQSNRSRVLASLDELPVWDTSGLWTIHNLGIGFGRGVWRWVMRWAGRFALMIAERDLYDFLEYFKKASTKGEKLMVVIIVAPRAVSLIAIPRP